jgi:plastocyanin
MISPMNSSWRGRGAVFTGLACCLIAAGCGSSSKSSSSSNAGSTPAAAASPTAATAIEIKDFKYKPPDLKAKAGAKLQIKNADSAEHTLTADDGAFDSGTIKPNGKGSVAFKKAGTYSFHCSFHAFMHGKVTVS